MRGKASCRSSEGCCPDPAQSSVYFALFPRDCSIGYFSAFASSFPYAAGARSTSSLSASRTRYSRTSVISSFTCALVAADKTFDASSVGH